jgi:hypothetical protein
VPSHFSCMTKQAVSKIAPIAIAPGTLPTNKPLFVNKCYYRELYLTNTIHFWFFPITRLLITLPSSSIYIYTLHTTVKLQFSNTLRELPKCYNIEVVSISITIFSHLKTSHFCL